MSFDRESSIAKSFKLALRVVWGAVSMGTTLWTEGKQTQEFILDQVDMHALAIEESLKPIRPGIPG